MGAEYSLVKTLIRSATENENREALPDAQVRQVYSLLRDLQDTLRGQCEGGRILTSSEINRSKFGYALTGGGTGPEEWLAACERALEWVESCSTVTAVRSILQRRRRTYPDFYSMRGGDA